MTTDAKSQNLIQTSEPIRPGHNTPRLKGGFLLPSSPPTAPATKARAPLTDLSIDMARVQRLEEKLTPEERDCLKLFLQKLPPIAVAGELNMSTNTLRIITSRLLKKSGTQDLEQLTNSMQKNAPELILPEMPAQKTPASKVKTFKAATTAPKTPAAPPQPAVTAKVKEATSLRASKPTPAAVPAPVQVKAISKEEADFILGKFNGLNPKFRGLVRCIQAGLSPEEASDYLQMDELFVRRGANSLRRTFGLTPSADSAFKQLREYLQRPGIVLPAEPASGTAPATLAR
jgi:DNA-binding CsgD family transcriptional regulator